MKLSGNTILITGGTSGIGRAFAEAFARLGNTVAICGRRQERLDEITRQYPAITGVVCDLANAKQREDLIRNVVAGFPALNVLVNNAGVQYAADLTRPIDVAAAREEIETNFVAPVHLSSLVAGHLKEQPAAAIINISSGLAFTPLVYTPIYSATKAALHSWTMSLRKQLESTTIKVYELAPPSVDTELGYQRRVDKSQSHGGMPPDEFVREALKAIERDDFQAGIGPAANMMRLRDDMFEQLNGR